MNTDKMEYGSAANHYLTALVEAAALKGVDVDILMQGIGLSRQDLYRPEHRIPTQKLADLQKAIWQWMNDESMGLNDMVIPYGSYYMMGQLTVNQPTLRKALILGIRFYNLLFRREQITLQENGKSVTLRLVLHKPELDYHHLFAEICLLSWHRYAAWLIADELPIIESHFPYPTPAHVGEYSYLFPGPHNFESKELSLIFPTHYLDREVRQNSASLKVFMNRCPLELFRQYKADYSLSGELKPLIKSGLQNRIVTIQYCANKMHMTPRTLMRKLRDEGTSFQQLKDIIRRDRAMHFLSQTTISINEVAERVGYSDPAVFTRAFRSWTGDTPRAYRMKTIDE